MKRLPEESAVAARRVGDVVGISAALIGTIVLHFVMFGGDQYFALRFLLTPAGDPIAFAAFAGSLVVLIVKSVKASRADQWGVLFGAYPVSIRLAADHPVDEFLTSGGSSVDPTAKSPVLGALIRRALKAAAIVAAGATLFVAIFIISVIPVFVIVFGVAALLIAAFYIVMRVIAGRELGADRLGAD